MAGKRILLVEGRDDKYVFRAIFGQRQLEHLDDIKEHGGKDELLEALPVQLKESDVEAVGIVLDADDNCSARWEAVRSRLITSGYLTVPEEPAAGGTIIHAPANSLLPRVGVWLMPDNRISGILEDFLRYLIPEPNPLYAHAITSVDAIPVDARLFSNVARPKVLIHTWLAWQTDSGIPFGQAITARFLDPTLPAADQLVNWLRALYFPP